MKDQAARVMELAKKQRMTLATVESCTAGSLAHLLSAHSNGSVLKILLQRRRAGTREMPTLSSQRTCSLQQIESGDFRAGSDRR
jgi:competence-damaged protein